MGEYKIFPWTYDGKDQLRIVFDYEEECEAFERALYLLKNRIKRLVNDIDNEVEQNKRNGYVVRDFLFETTLQYEIVSENLDIMKTLLGVVVLNVFRKDEIRIIITPDKLKFYGES